MAVLPGERRPWSEGHLSRPRSWTQDSCPSRGLRAEAALPGGASAGRPARDAPAAAASRRSTDTAVRRGPRGQPSRGPGARSPASCPRWLGTEKKADQRCGQLWPGPGCSSGQESRSPRSLRPLQLSHPGPGQPGSGPPGLPGGEETAGGHLVSCALGRKPAGASLRPSSHVPSRGARPLVSALRSAAQLSDLGHA